MLAGLLALGLVGAAACGGSSDDSADDSGDTTTTTVEAAVAVTDASSDAIGEVATVRAADLGEGWSEYREAGGWTEIRAKSCGTKFGSPLTSADRTYVGPMFRDANEQTFVYSAAIVFQDEADAKAFTTALETPEYVACKVDEDDAAERKRNEDGFVRENTAAQSPPLGTGGLEGFYEEEAGSKDADGEENVSASYSRYTFRVGRVVFAISIDTALPSDQAASEALGTLINAALNDSNAAIQARLSTLDV
jgi:hypothetical protein